MMTAARVSVVTRMRFAPLFLLPVLLAANTVAELLQEAEKYIEQERFALAEPLLEKAVRLNPDDVRPRYRLGYVFYRQRKLAEARSNFEFVAESAPPALHSRYFLGRIALLENRSQEAVRWLEPVAGAREAVFDAASQLALAYASAGEVRKAIAMLRQALAGSPWDGSLYYRLGQLHRRLGEAELAREALENSRRLQAASREDVEIIMNTSRSLREGDVAGARRLSTAILDRPNADPNALVALGVVFGGANMQAEALQAFQRAAGRDTAFFQAHFNQGLALLKLGRTAEALDPLAKSVRLLPQSQEANMTYGLASVMNRRYAEAIEPLERALQGDPENGRVGALLATAYLRTGSPAKAIPILRNAAQQSAADAAPLLLLVEALDAADDGDGALEAARLARKQFPSLPQAHMAAAQQLAKLGRYQEARPAFEQTLRLAPGLSEAELGLADTLQKAAEHAAAAGHYRSALHAPATALAARLGLARSLVALKRLEEARTLLEDGLPSAPSDPTLRLELSRVYARLGLQELAAEQAKIFEQIKASQPAP